MDEIAQLLSLIKKISNGEAYMPYKLDFEEVYKVTLLHERLKEHVKLFDNDWDKMHAYFNEGEENGKKKLLSFWEKEIPIFAEEYKKRINLLQKLPKEVLDTVEDIRFLALGCMTKETQKALRVYLKNTESSSRFIENRAE